jgi:4'-phosphopantetheinyl transferase EntD
MNLAPRLLGLPIRTAEMDPRASTGALFPVEEASVARAVPKRRSEFIAGRTCARRAMAALGERAVAIPQGVDRAPVWPDGLVGSITHTDTWCAAAVARRSDGVRALGLDVESDEPIRMELARIICRPEERAFIRAQPAAQRGRLTKLLFSAKESAYKCQYALSGRMLSYHAMRIDLDLPARRFTAVFQVDAAPFAAGDELSGELLVDSGYLMTAVALAH